MHREVCLPVAWKSIFKYVLASFIMGSIMFFVLPPTTTLVPTTAKAIAGFAIYVGLLLAIDAQARKLIRLIGEEIKGSLGLLKSENDNSLK
jgi:hydrogenase/urease accessory protein HupE